jgi:transcriptional regulator of PTS gene
MRITDQTFNRLRTLRLLRRHGAISRVELAQHTGLTKATITALTDEFVGKGLITEDKPTQAPRGRPRINLRIRQDAAYAIGFFPLMDGTASIDIIDLHGNSVYQEIGTFSRPPSIEALPETIAALMEQCLVNGPIPRSAISAAAIVIPGQVDHRNGVVHWMPPLSPHAPLPLKALLEPRIGFPVVVDNRATVMARAEHWFGNPGKSDDFSLFALMELGMSGARYADGFLQVGFNGMNAEMSHIKVAFEGGRPCMCGGTGCLGSYVTTIAIAFMLAERRGQEHPPIPMVGQAFASAVAQAQAGDADACAVFATAGRALGTALASHVNEQDPGRVIVTGVNSALLEMVTPSLRETFERQLLPSLKSCTELDIRSLPPGMAWRGAAALAIEAVFLSS